MRLSEAEALPPVTRTYRRFRSGLQPFVVTTWRASLTWKVKPVSKQVGLSSSSSARLSL